MRIEIVQTSNVARVMAMTNRLLDEGRVDERMGLLHGLPGQGKTKAITHAVTQFRGVYLRATKAWSMTTMLKALAEELYIEPRGYRSQIQDGCVQALVEDPRPVFVDEADYLLQTGRTDMLDVLRDVYDLSGSPVILVGMEEIVHRIRKTGRWARFYRRITERVEFSGMPLADAQRVAGQLCEVEVEGALPPGASVGDVDATGTLVERLYAEAEGSIGHYVPALARVERAARTNGLDRIDVALWDRIQQG